MRIALWKVLVGFALWFLVLKRVVKSVSGQSAGVHPDQSAAYMETHVICDKSCYEAIRRNGHDPVTFLDTLIKETSRRLGTRLNITISMTGLEVWTKRDLIQPDRDMQIYRKRLSTYRDTTQLAHAWSDLTVLITDLHMTDSRSHAFGGTYYGGVCTRKYGVTVVKYREYDMASLSQTLLHEIGHALEMSHDTDGCCHLGRTVCTMWTSFNHYQVQHYIFSKCSLEALKGFWKKQKSVCLKNRPLKAADIGHVNSRCGNGVVDHGEECDCGNACVGGCCNCCVNCRLKASATCYHGDCCNTTACQYKEATAICHAGEPNNPCDEADYCSGNSSQCFDTHEEDGKTCTDSTGETSMCWKGQCLTRTNQCKKTWNAGYQNADEECYRQSLRFGSEYSHCGAVNEPAGMYHKCTTASTRNYKCGLLQCTNNNRSTSINMDTSIYRRPKQNPLIHSALCRSASHGEWESIQGPLSVADGTVCGPQKACWKYNCIDQQVVLSNMRKEQEKEESDKEQRAICGNGVVEHGEECDCGPMQCDCCEPHTCKLRPGGATCLSQECLTCDGKQTKCTSQPARSAVACDFGEGQCWQGSCRSLRQQCQRVFDKNAVPAISEYQENTRMTSSEHNGGGYLLYYNRRRRWEKTFREFVTAEGDGVCGVLLCQTTSRYGRVHDEKGERRTSKTFYLRSRRNVKVVYYAMERVYMGGVSYTKYFPHLVAIGTPCTKDGQKGHCDTRNLKLDSRQTHWYYYSRCVTTTDA